MAEGQEKSEREREREERERERESADKRATQEDKIIFSGEYTKAMSKDWHSGHFCCWQCDESLTGQRYVLKDDHPYCIKCYEAVFANSCDDCNTVIGIDSKDLSYKEKHWHEKCFLCNKCQVSLVDKQFGSKMDKIFCGPCYDAQFATRCDGCGEIFRAGASERVPECCSWVLSRVSGQRPSVSSAPSTSQGVYVQCPWERCPDTPSALSALMRLGVSVLPQCLGHLGRPSALDALSVPERPKCPDVLLGVSDAFLSASKVLS
ncbi:hypothetical protein O3P69_019948 [Scylla paramamosain]|uniref:LIM zinc-binding domain-containing protein n=1 Tax=Scylla paramamosain TaxID=85552 RepID=A0AAW0SBZ7_SCYPA